MKNIKEALDKDYMKIKNVLFNRCGMGTVEVVIIVVVLIGIALMFRNGIEKFVGDLLANLDADKIEINY